MGDVMIGEVILDIGMISFPRCFSRPQDLTHPSNWYFAVAKSNLDFDPLGTDIVRVSFTPIAYWDEHHHCIDEHVSPYLKAHLPKYLSECQEAHFDVCNQVSMEQVTKDLLKVGFQQSDEYTKFVETHDI